MIEAMDTVGQGRKLAEGKTKVIYAVTSASGTTRARGMEAIPAMALAMMEHKDAITAGDGARRHALPAKGSASCHTMDNVFRLLEGTGVPTHYVRRIDERRTLVRRCAMIPVEVVTRRLATGSYLRRHAGVAEGARFDPPVVELFLKDDARHDPLVTPDELAAAGVADHATVAAMTSRAARAFLALEAEWSRLGVTLVDLKVECGRDDAGRLRIADIIDNDSWRLWPDGRRAEMLDKQVYRDLAEVTGADLARVAANYARVATLTDAFGAGATAGGDTRARGEECGVTAAIIPGGDATPAALAALHALQHRGQESAGIAWREPSGALAVHKGMGLVAHVFADAPAGMAAPVAIGHTRYSTSGASHLANAQPFIVHGPAGPLALAHNGHLLDVSLLRRLLEERNVAAGAATDSAVLAAGIAHAPGAGWPERIRWALGRVAGSYGLVLLTDEGVYAARDPLGNRPLALGRLNGRDDGQGGESGWIIASESCAFQTAGAHVVRDVEPGEIVRLDGAGARTVGRVERVDRAPDVAAREAFCAFEYIYLARPDSHFGSRGVYEARRDMGRALARERPARADLVAAVPDSGTAAALGFAAESGLPFGEALIKNRYIGRTFIHPGAESRGKALALKFAPLAHIVDGKRVVLVDDSLVRGATMRALVALLRGAGAAEIHLRIAAPPVRWPCFFGVDIATTGELIAHDRDEEEVARILGADSLGYLSLDGLAAATAGAGPVATAGAGPVDGAGLCVGCFTGRYPIALPLPPVAPAAVLQGALS